MLGRLINLLFTRKAETLAPTPAAAKTAASSRHAAQHQTQTQHQPQPGRVATASANAATSAQPSATAPCRLLAVDIDGTLLRSDHRLSGPVRKAIAEAQRKGVKLVLATARPPRATQTVYNHLGLNTMAIHYNGAAVHCPTNNRFHMHQTLAPHLAKQLIETARDMVPNIVVHLEIDDRWVTDHNDPKYQTNGKLKPDVVGPLDAHLNQAVTKILFKDTPPTIERLQRHIADRFAGQVALPQSATHMLQIVTAGSTKANALAYIAQQYGIRPEETIAIGDAPNDEPMLAWAGLGLCVANGWRSTKAMADAVVPSNDDDGVQHAIEQYILDAAA